MERMLAWIAVMLLPVLSHAADLHQMWDRQCGGCHGHAGSFVREHLRLAEGRLRDRGGGRDVSTFLQTHNGGYPPETIAALIEMMAAQVATPDLFKDRCGGCHETAAQLVRDQLAERDGRLVGLDSGRPLAELLPGHARMNQGEQAQIQAALERIYREVHHKP